MTTDENLEEFLNKTIYHWVGRNFGSQEANDPSWNIEALSKYLAKELSKMQVKLTGHQPYELTVLIPTELDRQTEIDKVAKIVHDYGGVITEVSSDGVKRLAYSINGHEQADYNYMTIFLPDGAPVKISNALNVDDGVLRYLMVKKDTRR